MRVQLGEVCTPRSSLVDPALVEYRDLPHIGPDSIEKGTGRLLTYRSAAEDGVTSGKYRFSSGDILYSKIRPNLNKVTRATFDGLCSADMYALDVESGRASPEFITYVLRGQLFLAYAATVSNRANIPKLNRDQLMRFEFELPSIAEQRRIAEILAHADTLRAKRRQVLAHLDALTQSVFHDMFGDVPWTTKFGSIIAHGPTNGLYRPASEYGAGTPILRIDGFDRGMLRQQVWKRVDLAESDVERYQLSVGDIVINRVNALSHLGKSTLVEGLTEPSVYESNMMRIRLDTDRALPRFVLEWLQTMGVRQQILRSAKKAINQASINQRDVTSLSMPLPAMKEQEQFSARIHHIKTLRVVQQRAAEADDVLFGSLQSSAFRGELA